MVDTAIVMGVGATQGLGPAFCRRLALDGLHVLVAGRTSAKIEAVAKEIDSGGGAATPIVADILHPADVAAVFDAAESAGRVPEPAIYNAGDNEMRPPLEMDDAFFEEVCVHSKKLSDPTGRSLRRTRRNEGRARC